MSNPADGIGLPIRPQQDRTSILCGNINQYTAPDGRTVVSRQPRAAKRDSPQSRQSTVLIQGLNRSGVSGPAVSLPRARRIRSSVGCMAGSPARLCCSWGPRARRNSSSRTSPSRRMYVQSPSVRAARGHAALSHREGSGSNDPSGTTSESTWSEAAALAERRRRPRPEPGQRSRERGNRPGSPARSTIVAARSRRLTVSATTVGRAPRRRNDHQRNMELRLVETRSVPEHAGMLAEALAVVRGDDHPGPLENGTAIELVDQPAELLVEIRDAVVVGVAAEIDLVRGRPVLDQAAANPGSRSTRDRSRLDPESVDARRRKLIRIVGVKVIQEGEERPLRLPPPDSQSRNSRLTTAASFRLVLKSHQR